MKEPAVFANLDTYYVCELESALLSLFNGISTVDGRKSIFICAGIKESFIYELDWNLNLSESINILVAKFIKYKISDKRLNYHPLVKIIFYILQQPQERYNLDDNQIYVLEEILYFGKKKIEAFNSKNTNYQELLAREREEPSRTLNYSTEKKIEQKIIVKYDLEDLEAVLTQ